MSVGDERSQPWFWLRPSTMKLIRSDRVDGDPGLSQIIAVYTSMCELANEARARTNPSAAESDCFASTRTKIARRSGTSPKTVDRVSGMLERLGALRIERRRQEEERNLPNRYWLRDPGGGVGDSETPTGEQGDAQVGDSETPKRSRSKTTKNTPTPQEGQGEAALEKIFAFWCEVMEKGAGTRFSKKRKRKVEQRLAEDFTPTEIGEAIRGCALTPHNMGHNDRGPNGTGKPFNDLELICREPEKVEDFRDTYRASRKRAKGPDANERRKRARKAQGLT